MQEAIVALLVVGAAWMVAKRYLPAALRRRLVAATARLARHCGLGGLAARLEAQRPAAASCADGCSTCGACESAKPDAAAADTDASTGSAAQWQQVRFHDGKNRPGKQAG